MASGSFADEDPLCTREAACACLLAEIRSSLVVRRWKKRPCILYGHHRFVSQLSTNLGIKLRQIEENIPGLFKLAVAQRQTELWDQRDPIPEGRFTLVCIECA